MEAVIKNFKKGERPCAFCDKKTNVRFDVWVNGTGFEDVCADCVKEILFRELNEETGF